MIRSLICIFLLGLSTGCAGTEPGAPPAATATKPVSLAEARKGFSTKLVRQVAQNQPVPNPPATLFRVVRYPSPAGQLAAYLSSSGKAAGKRPAIVWIFGGFGNDIGDTAWQKAPASNDQSASAFRQAGVITMFPAFRGGNDNPGFQEGFYGEVDDVLAAADFLAKQPDVDPKRIYLGGHSTGGTLALLAAEADTAHRFRAVFSFGPTDDVAGYGREELYFDFSNPQELALRAPVRWLDSVTAPVFAFEGTNQGNLAALQTLARASKNPRLHFYPVSGATHFSILAPVTTLLAKKIEADTGPTCSIAISPDELNRLPSH